MLDWFLRDGWRMRAVGRFFAKSQKPLTPDEVAWTRKMVQRDHDQMIKRWERPEKPKKQKR